MSIILDALKKSESDQQRQSGPALFEVKVAPPKARLPVWAIAIGALLIVNMFIVGYLLLRRSSHGDETNAANTGTAADGRFNGQNSGPQNGGGQGNNGYANQYNGQGNPGGPRNGPQYSNGGQPYPSQGNGTNPNGMVPGGGPNGGGFNGADPNGGTGTGFNRTDPNGGNGTGFNRPNGANGSGANGTDGVGPDGDQGSAGQGYARQGYPSRNGQPYPNNGQQGGNQYNNGAPGQFNNNQQGGANDGAMNGNGAAGGNNPSGRGNSEPTLANRTREPGAENGPPANPEDYAPATEPQESNSLFKGHVKRGTESGVPLYQDMAVVPGANLPNLRLDLHVYAAAPHDRFALINMRKMHEGDAFQDGTRVDSITPEGVIMSHNGSKFLLPRD
jgi:hypothetical protein